jgi:hypothetical protein
MNDHQKKGPFVTERTARWLAKDIDARDRGIVENIEHYGCSILHIKKGTISPVFSYTIGVYDTCGKPEIIQVGLVEKTAQFLLNEAVRRLRNGEQLTEGRHQDLIGDFDCAFRPLDPTWNGKMMTYTSWFNGNADFPALQAVWPDFKNRFPWDDGFDEDVRARQPLLYVGATQTRVEEDLWASFDRESSFFDWKFPDPPHTVAYLSQAVQSGVEAVTYVSHDIDDGAWQFLGDSMSADLPPKISCLHHPIDNDATLKELFDLPRGWYAERATPNDPWVRGESPQEEEE